MFLLIFSYWIEYIRKKAAQAGSSDCQERTKGQSFRYDNCCCSTLNDFCFQTCSDWIPMRIKHRLVWQRRMQRLPRRQHRQRTLPHPTSLILLVPKICFVFVFFKSYWFLIAHHNVKENIKDKLLIRYDIYVFNSERHTLVSSRMYRHRSHRSSRCCTLAAAAAVSYRSCCHRLLHRLQPWRHRQWQRRRSLRRPLLVLQWKLVK